MMIVVYVCLCVHYCILDKCPILMKLCINTASGNIYAIYKYLIQFPQSYLFIYSKIGSCFSD